MGKDKGWNFLNSKDRGFLGGEDGNSQKFSDGSGYYHGADGSYGSIDADGSGYYHGADGSYGYRDTDGSGYFHGADGSYRYYDADDEHNRGSDYESESDGATSDVLAALIGLGIAGISVHAANKETERIRAEERRREWEAEEKKRKEKAKEKRTKRMAFYKKHWKGLVILFIVIFTGCFGGYKYYQYQRSVPVGVSTEDLVGRDYTETVSLLENAGFTNVSSEPKYDIEIDKVELERKVESVSIAGHESFDSNDRYPFDANIIIAYHMVKDINVPLSAKEAKKLQYDDLEKQLRDAGFVNITLEPKYDLLKGIIRKEGRVKSISINGDSSFKADTSYRPDAEIIIIYHTFIKDKK